MQSLLPVSRFTSRESAVVEETWHAYAPTAKLLRVDESSCRLQWFSAALPGVSLVEYTLSADVHSSIEPSDQFFTCSATAVNLDLTSRKQPLDASLPWASTGAVIETEWAGAAHVQAMIFDRDEAQRSARQLVGDDRLDLRVVEPSAMGRAAGKRWRLAFDYLAQTERIEADADERFHIMEAEASRHALVVALSVFSTSALRDPVQTLPVTRLVRRALAYIADHAHEPITVDDVAREVRISTRGLQYAFQRETGQTPSDHLRRARLEGAHRDLRTFAGEQSLTVIARRWGFSNVTRFSQRYAEVYGAHPRSVLHASAPR